jgi:hypothetical protein
MVVTSGPHKVVLLKVGTNSYKARPAYQPTAPNEEIRFINLTEDEVVMTFPAGLFESTTLTLAAGAKGSRTVLDQLGDGRYTYTARVGGANGVVVDGESSPETIVDR